MSSLGWKINRIRAMSLKEIAFRAGRLIKLRLERRWILAGWKPKTINKVYSSEPMFAQSVDMVVETWVECFGTFDVEPYELALSKANLFSKFDVDINGPINWHLDPESGITAPLSYGKELDYRDNLKVGNCKTLWELSRHKHLVPLAVAFVMTGRQRYTDKISDHIQGWINQNPFGMGVNWCSSLEVALRLIAWSFTHHLLMIRDRRGLFGLVNDEEQLSESIFLHAYFIRNYLSRYSSANNHLIGELTGLWIGCKCFNMGDAGRRWGAFAKQELIIEADLQVFEDGVSKEQATYYHLWVNEYLLLAWLVGRRYGESFGRSFTEKVSRMSQFLSDLKPKGGCVPQIGDSDDGVVLGFDPYNKTDPYEELLSAVSLISRMQQGHSTDNIDILQKAFWYAKLYKSALDDKETLYTDRDMGTNVKVYPSGGYVIFGDDSMRGVFDAGSLGYPSIAAHGHADALSLCLAFNGNWWVVDPGTYCYHTEPEWRNYFRGTGAHNTVLINRTNQSLIGGAFLWLKHGITEMDKPTYDEEKVYIGGSVQGYASRGSVHRREIRIHMGESRLSIIDIIEGKDRDTYEIRFHFHPDVDLHRVSTGLYEATHKQHTGRVMFTVSGELEWVLIHGQTDPLLGWYSEKLGQRRACNVLIGHGQCSHIRRSHTVVDWSESSVD